MRVSIFAAALAVASLPIPAVAETVKASTFLYEEISAPGESMDAFVSRISPKAIEVTEARRVSICGAIGQANDRFSIRLGTSNTWKSCDIDLTDTVAGYASTGVTFHTTTGDEGSQRGFSAENFKRPRGYVAFGKHVRYQEGRTNDRLISSP
ncbi:hypothetical protein [Staphylococcus aureus]|uniref:hypothetical protein n=1 Tax=Staphylococcus aureus TaxID=1280 RepID=UPI001FD4EB59|nr:hypothetical protein [Staphylococcus aureus]MCJ8005673.1 hypothetical protein [Staphylococcus aureus]MCJ8032925.1 hypothetical protein [Staphylococcus aureus]